MHAGRSAKTVQPEDLFKRLQALTQLLPAELELHRLLLNLSDPANDERAKDRYTALIAGGAVEEGLRIAIENTGNSAPRTFADKISKAEVLALVTPDERIELNKVRLVRNAFAHALAPISFDDPTILEGTKGLWAHPVSSWSGYFAPVFAPRDQFAIVCAEFFHSLTQRRPILQDR